MATSPLKIALIGRVNVGKSTLFNRLTETRQALVSAAPGTTRDRRETTVTWRGRRLMLVDTGGVDAPTKRRPKEKALRKTTRGVHGDLQPLITVQTERALADADMVALVVSAEDGVLPQDIAWAEALRGKYPTILVANKVDNRQRELGLGEFYRLGLGEPIPVSAISGRGSGDLLDIVVRRVKNIPRRASANSELTSSTKNADISVAIVGQPNSGKSSLLNAILGEERVVVSPIPHTTREPIDTLFEYNNHTLRLIDTAGIRRKARLRTGLEQGGVYASLDTLERADVVVLVIDIERGPTLQDQRLGQIISERGKGFVLVANKWDLVPGKNAKTIKETEMSIRSHLPGTMWAPMIFVSAKTGQRVPQVLDAVLAAMSARQLKLEESTLDEFLLRVTKLHRPSRGGGVRHPIILSFKQMGIVPPRFEVVTRGELNPSYLKFLENRLRDQFGFVGTPIHIDLKAKRKRIER